MSLISTSNSTIYIGGDAKNIFAPGRRVPLLSHCEIIQTKVTKQIQIYISKPVKKLLFTLRDCHFEYLLKQTFFRSVAYAVE